MRFTITIPQAGLAAADLLGRVSIEALIALGAAARFFLSAKSTRLKAEQGADFVWIDAGHLLNELPILWPARPDKTRRNNLSRAMKELVAAELLQTRRGARGRLFVRLTELALGLETSHRPENRDGTIPTTRDGERAALYKENQRNEPCAGANDFEMFWKAYPKKRDRIKAQRAWNATVSIRPPISTLLSALDTFTQSRDWNDRDGKFIPYPSSWLHGRRWEEVSTKEIPAQPAPEREPDPPGWIDALQYLYPECWWASEFSFADLKHEHPDIAAAVVAKLDAPATDNQ
jgi:hypothetical protein